MVNELITSVLKEYIMPSDYDLHDWDTIIERRTQYTDDVYIYHCVYADIYMTDTLEFYDAEPKQPIHMDLKDSLMSEEHKLIASVLKEYVMPTDYDLHDWEDIINRRELVEDGVYSYPCVYANILLTDTLEFYDAEPKQPIHHSLNTLNEWEELVVSTLSGYIPYEFREDIDWKTVISRREEIMPNVYKYAINNIDFCLDDMLNPIEHDKIHIIDNKIYYDFNLTENGTSPYILFSEV